MKMALGRLASICLLGAILSYSGAALVACTSTHDCLKAPKRSELTLIQDSVVIPENISTLAVSSTIHRLKVERGVDPQGKLLLDNPNNPKTGEKEFTLKTETTDSRLTAKVENLSDPTKLDHAMLNDLTLTIVLPARFSGKLEGHTVSADIEIPELAIATCRFQTVSGHFRATKLACAETNLSTTSGDFTVDSLTGTTLGGRSVSGEFSFNHARLETSAELQSVSGDIEVTFDGIPASKASCGSVSGDCIFTLPANPVADVALRSISGTITTKHPVLSTLRGTVRNEHELKGSFESTTPTAAGTTARPSIEGQTTSGDIELR